MFTIIKTAILAGLLASGNGQYHPTSLEKNSKQVNTCKSLAKEINEIEEYKQELDSMAMNQLRLCNFYYPISKGRCLNARNLYESIDDLTEERDKIKDKYCQQSCHKTEDVWC